MTDEINPPETPSSNGFSKAGAPAVRSALAHRRNPALVAVGDFLGTVRRGVLRDPLALFLALASLGLAITFATLLGDIKPSSSGRQVPLSTVQALAKHHQIGDALLLDHDSRVEVTTKTPLRVEADGELLGMTPATFQLYENALRLKV